MKITTLAKKLCKREGKKHQVNVADMLEVLAALGDELLRLPFMKQLALLDKLTTLAEKRRKKTKR